MEFWLHPCIFPDFFPARGVQSVVAAYFPQLSHLCILLAS
jgi:hypothetical protein